MLKNIFCSKIILFVFFFSVFGIFFFTKPQKVDTANFTTAFAILSNSRLSYRAGVGNTTASGDSYITIDSSGNADNNTNHLFPGDTVCFEDTSLSAPCRESRSVANIIDTTSFNLSTGATVALALTDFVMVKQTGSLTLYFTTVSEVPVGGDLLITIPAVNSTATNDTYPDTAATAATNGFDLNGIGSGDITIAGCTGANWGSATVTAGDASNDHTVRFDRSSTSCSAGTGVTVTIDSSPGLLNPAPLTSGHTQGAADVYTININSRDAANAIIDQIDIKVAPVEGVFVSATVDESLSFAIAGRGVGSTSCNQIADITTTATSVPWGTISTADTFYDGAQQLTVSTNADGGYAVRIEENDQMGKDGVACSGASADESNNCIKDTVCAAGNCSESTSADWTAAGTYHGLGYSLENVDGSDATFIYSESSRTYSAKQLADQEANETKATVMSSASPVNSKDIYVCYRIAVSATQPAGYYFNRVKYTATATF